MKPPKFPKLTGQVMAGCPAISLEARIRRIEDVLAQVCSVIDDLHWDGMISREDLRALGEFAHELQIERDREKVRTVAGVEPA